jgi:hypothetical protein
LPYRPTVVFALKVKLRSRQRILAHIPAKLNIFAKLLKNSTSCAVKELLQKIKTVTYSGDGSIYTFYRFVPNQPS